MILIFLHLLEISINESIFKRWFDKKEKKIQEKIDFIEKSSIILKWSKTIPTYINREIEREKFNEKIPNKYLI